jgi:pimeloyl-ACP methyl ester carboxylesterase
LTFYHHIVMLPPEEIEGARSLPRYPALVAMAPTIPRELQAEDGWFAAFDLAGLSGFGTPTLLLLLLLLLLLGGDSPATQKAAAEALEAALPDCRIVVLPGEGNLAHRTAPELFVREVVQLLVHR